MKPWQSSPMISSWEGPNLHKLLDEIVYAAFWPLVGKHRLNRLDWIVQVERKLPFCKEMKWEWDAEEECSVLMSFWETQRSRSGLKMDVAWLRLMGLKNEEVRYQFAVKLKIGRCVDQLVVSSNPRDPPLGKIQSLDWIVLLDFYPFLWWFMDRYLLFSMVQTKVQLRKSSLKAILDLLTKPIKALGQNKQFEI